MNFKEKFVQIGGIEVARNFHYPKCPSCLEILNGIKTNHTSLDLMVADPAIRLKGKKDGRGSSEPLNLT